METCNVETKNLKKKLLLRKTSLLLFLSCFWLECSPTFCYCSSLLSSFNAVSFSPFVVKTMMYQGSLVLLQVHF